MLLYLGHVKTAFIPSYDYANSGEIIKNYQLVPLCLNIYIYITCSFLIWFTSFLFYVFSVFFIIVCFCIPLYYLLFKNHFENIIVMNKLCSLKMTMIARGIPNALSHYICAEVCWRSPWRRDSPCIDSQMHDPVHICPLLISVRRLSSIHLLCQHQYSECSHLLRIFSDWCVKFFVRVTCVLGKINRCCKKHSICLLVLCGKW